MYLCYLYYFLHLWCQMYYLNLRMFEEETFFSTFSLFGLAFCLDQVSLAFALHQVVLRRCRGLALDHGEAKHEEENVPNSLHGASFRCFWQMFQFMTSKLEAPIVINCPYIAAIKYEIARGG